MVSSEICLGEDSLWKYPLRRLRHSTSVFSNRLWLLLFGDKDPPSLTVIKLWHDDEISTLLLMVGCLAQKPCLLTALIFVFYENRETRKSDGWWVMAISWESIIWRPLFMWKPSPKHFFLITTRVCLSSCVTEDILQLLSALWMFCEANRRKLC